MTIRQIALLHFRNYPAFRHEFAPGLNVLVGENAQGKSNLLEAVSILATTKSMRGARDVEMIEWDHNAAVVTGWAEREATYDIELEVGLSRSEPKSLALNGAHAGRVVDFVGQLKAVTFSTADVDVVRGEPALRRRFLDLDISQTSPSYCHTLACYRKVLEQRGRLLKTMRDTGARGSLSDSLTEWSAQLVHYGSRLVERRAAFVARLQELAQPIHARMTGDREHLGVIYQSSFPLPERRTQEEIAFAFTQALETARPDEIRRGLSLVGPHLDDVGFLFNGHRARVFGSQGQQRTVMLSTRLAELELMREASGEDPLCLLDDVLSELDEHRRAHLFETVAGVRQVLLTCTDLDDLPQDVRTTATVHHVREGHAERVVTTRAA